MNIYQKAELAIKDAVSIARLHIPIDTGNMSLNAFNFEYLGNMRWKISIDEKKAPYVPFVNEKWISPRWGGKQNPNEGFWQGIRDSLVAMISASLNGKIKWS